MDSDSSIGIANQLRCFPDFIRDPDSYQGSAVSTGKFISNLL
jgi:hypothetical protein